MALALLAEGHDVTAVDLNGAGLDDLIAQAAGLRGAVNTVAAELAERDSFAQVTASALVRFGRIDVLVNNAGIGQFALRADQRRTLIRFWETTLSQ